MADSPSPRTQAFISYSHADEEHRKRLRIHLRHSIREQNIDVWDDTRIGAGALWKDEIRRAIASAKVAILLVSADFLASDFIANNELPPLLDAAKKDGLVIFSIILSASAFQQTRLADYQTFNKPSEPLIRLPKDRQEEIWAKLAEKVTATLAPPPISRKEPDVSPKNNEQGLNEEDKQNDTRIEQASSDPSPQQFWLKSVQPITQLVGHRNGVTALALSPDNQMLVSGDERGKVKVWDLAKKTSFAPAKLPAIGTLAPFHPLALNSVTSIVFHPEGRTFFASWRSGKINIWECQTGELLETFEAPHPRPLFEPGKGVECLAVSPDGLVIISGGENRIETAGEYVYRAHGSRWFPGVPGIKSLQLWKYPKTDKDIDVENYPYMKKIGSDLDSTLSIAFSTKGNFFAASSSDRGIRIWNIAKGREERLLKDRDGFSAFFTGLTFHPDENLLAAINREGQCLIWDLPTGGLQKVLDPLSGKITAIAFSPRGSHLIVAHSSGAMGFRSPFSEEWIKPFKAHEQSISALVYSSDGHHLMSGSMDKTIKMWEIIETRLPR